MVTLFDATPGFLTGTDKPRDANPQEVAAYLVWIALRRGIFIPADADFQPRGIWSPSDSAYILEMPGYGQSQTVTCEILDDAGNVVRSMPLPVDKRGKLPMTALQAKDWTGLQNVRKPRKAAAKPEHVAAAPEGVAVAPEPVAIAVEAPAPALEPVAAAVAHNDDEPAPDALTAADAIATAALEAAGCPSPGNAECNAVWFRYVAAIVGASGPDAWSIETGRKQADRKARNRGKVVISGDAYRYLLDRFHELPPMRAAAEQHAPALPSEPAPVPVVTPAADDGLAATVAALVARVASLERAAAPAVRPVRTAAHLRAIRAYLKLRAERAEVARLIQSAKVAAAAARKSSDAKAREIMQLRAAADRNLDRRNDTAARLRKVRALVRWQDRNRAVMLASTVAAETDAAEARAALASLRVTAAADRAELDRLAPVVSALAALNRPALAIAA